MSSKDDRRDELAAMWVKTALAINRALDSKEPSASSLEVARKFLADNSITFKELRAWKAHPLGFDPNTLPTFATDDDENGSLTQIDALRVVPPFAPSDSNQ